MLVSRLFRSDVRITDKIIFERGCENVLKPKGLLRKPTAVDLPLMTAYHTQVVVRIPAIDEVSIKIGC